MKNKLSVIDINIVSAYMGRFLTAIVTVIVLGLTVSALVGRGGMRNHVPLVIAVPAVDGADATVARFEPLRQMLARETGRTVKVQARKNDGCGRCELFVLPIDELLSGRDGHGLVPVYVICAMDRGRDAAVLIAKKGVEAREVPSPGNVVFTHPRSANGCWVQLAWLESQGIDAPDRIESLNFAPSPGAGARVVYSVLAGEFPYGACRESDLAGLIATGSVGRDELTVVRSIPAVPEVVIACRPEDADYYERILKKIATRMAAPDPMGADRDAVELLKVRGMRSLRPVSEYELQSAASLFETMGERI
jgi:ABC-type phosphate/phosphonate transport system substrate-binding protein